MLRKTLNDYVFTLKITTAMFAETVDNSQHSTPPIHEGRNCTLNSGREDLRTLTEVCLNIAFFHSGYVRQEFQVESRVISKSRLKEK
jgi:hypothetical protein